MPYWIRKPAPDWIVLTEDQLVPPKPDLEEDAAAYLSAHHRSLALLGQELKKDVDEDLWRWYSVLSRLYLKVKSWVFGKPRTVGAILKDYEAAKVSSSAFVAHRKEQAKAKLAEIVNDPATHEDLRNHAAEALGYVVGRLFHRHADPCRAALKWLKKDDSA